jgi:hypothetical protein
MDDAVQEARAEKEAARGAKEAVERAALEKARASRKRALDLGDHYEGHLERGLDFDEDDD